MDLIIIFGSIHGFLHLIHLINLIGYLFCGCKYYINSSLTDLLIYILSFMANLYQIDSIRTNND
jgi:hypothetical protein